MPFWIRKLRAMGSLVSSIIWQRVSRDDPACAVIPTSASAIISSNVPGNTPTVDNLVVHRETWRTTIGESGLAARPRGELDRYLAVRAWRAGLGLPERVFIRVGTEIKPCYVDFTSPAYAAAFLAMVRSAHDTAGDGTRLTISELLPRPDQAWLPDAAGNRYFSELRITVVDPAGGPR